MKNELVLFRDGELELQVNVEIEKDTVWLTANQMAILFEKDEKTVRKHINNIFADEELERENNTQKMRVVGVKQKSAILFFGCNNFCWISSEIKAWYSISQMGELRIKRLHIKRIRSK
ncbi:MAG: hypothetical protein PHW34_03665 [Hespellia sp.]|nr:hypothetical protein [Hespellia sp.]